MKVLVLGATAAMVAETLRLLAREGAELVLAARRAEPLEDLVSELRQAGAGRVEGLPFEAAESGRAGALVDRTLELLGGLELLLVAHGELTDQAEAERDWVTFERSLQINGTSAVEALMRAAAHFDATGHGHLVAISSGAGARGRRSTYAYGIGKSMVTLCQQGLRARFRDRPIQVLTVFPCFVSTPMTAYLPRRLRWIDADAAGRRIHAALRSGRDELWIPRFWRLALILARNLPEALAKRSKSEERLLESLRAGHD